MGSRHWTEPELEILQSLVGDMPWPMVTRAYNTQAGTLGLQRRTTTALERKCDNLGLQRRSIGKWITTGFIAEMTGISRTTIQRWIARGILPARDFWSGGRFKRHYVSRDDLCKLARQRPDLFGGIPEPQLVMLFNNEQVAADIVALELPSIRQRRPVICIERGRKYPSIHRAAKAVYVTPQRLRVVLDTDLTAGGYHWRTA